LWKETIHRVGLGVKHLTVRLRISVLRIAATGVLVFESDEEIRAKPTPPTMNRVRSTKAITPIHSTGKDVFLGFWPARAAEVLAL
jgi:hypothetical protein